MRNASVRLELVRMLCAYAHSPSLANVAIPKYTLCTFSIDIEV